MIGLQRRLVIRLQQWIADEVRRVLESQPAPLRLVTDNPMGPLHYAGDRLREVANAVGADVIVGHDVVIFNGKRPDIRGLQLGDRVRLYDACRFSIDAAGPESGIVLSADVALNFGCYIDGSGGVVVGERTIFGPNVVVVSSQHRVDGDRIRDSGKTFAEVRIGQDVWVGANSVIMAGVTIGDGAVVGSGAIVTKDVIARSIVAGNPARVLRARADVS
jgi:acetyltransferase-like isoleucine patch superfamily enzyme